MNAVTRSHYRISPKIHEALRLRVKEGLSWAECARRAGITEVGLHGARKRPAVQELEISLQNQFIASADKLKGARRSRALDHAEFLMKNAKSEAVQARMVELLAGERASGPQVNVQINQNAGQGYVYPRPGQVVEIIDGNATSPDSQSGADDSQVPDE